MGSGTIQDMGHRQQDVALCCGQRPADTDRLRPDRSAPNACPLAANSFAVSPGLAGTCRRRPASGLQEKS